MELPSHSGLLSPCTSAPSSTAVIHPNREQARPISTTSENNPRGSKQGLPKLPLELRLMIHDLIAEPRVVEVEWSIAMNSWFSPKESTHKPSVLLSIWKESREHYLRKWIPLRPCVGCQPSDHSLAISQLAAGIELPMSYINPGIDTLHIDGGQDRTMSTCVGLLSIDGFTRIAVNQHFPYQHFPIKRIAKRKVTHAGRYDSFFKSLEQSANIKEIHVVRKDIYRTSYRPWKTMCGGVITLSPGTPGDRAGNVLKHLLGIACPGRKFNIAAYEILRGGRHPNEFRQRILAAENQEYWEFRRSLGMIE